MNPRTVTVLAILSSLSVSRGALLLADNFNAATGNTTDLNTDLARQTGSIAPVPYTMAGGPGHYGHQLQNGNALNQLLVADFPNSTSSFNTNFNNALSAGGLRISFDVDPHPAIYANGDDSHWGCINIGASAANQLVDVNGIQPHVGILFRRTNGIQAFDGNTVLTGFEPLYSTTAGPGMRHLEILISDTDGNPFDGIGATTIDVFGDINGYTVPVFSYTKGSGGFTDNFMNLQGSFRAHFDNFSVVQIPEPALPMLAGVAAGLALLRRRR